MLKVLERWLKRLTAGAFRLLLRQRRPPAALPSDFHSILVIRQHNQLGDMLCVVPLLRALSTLYPGAGVSLLTSPVNFEAMLHHRYLADVINYDKSRFRGLGGPFSLVRFARGLRRRRFDLAIVPSTVSMSFTSELLALLSGAPVRVGASSIDGVPNPAAHLLTHPVALDWRKDPHRHQTLRNLDVAKGLRVNPPSLSLEITLRQDEFEEAKSLYLKDKSTNTSLIILHPGAGKRPNRWPADRFAEVANTLSGKHGDRIIVTLGQMDEEAGRVLQQNLQCPCEVIRNQPIRHVAAILSLADLVISNDTGIMHVAAAVGAPVLSLFGPTDPAQWAPLGEMHRFIQGEGGDVSAIAVDDVLRTAREMLRGDRRRRGYD
jgi:ADP-heptose:LPS heptosyltransferase